MKPNPIKNKRFFAQLFFFFTQNPFLANFKSGRIYQGDLKLFCTPGLNCYSCPAAAFSCPIGSLQLFFRGISNAAGLYVTGFLITTGAVFGRFICGFVCPMGFLQDILYRVPVPKFKTRLRTLSYVKYIVLILTVIILPLTIRDFWYGDPWFCKYICPSGTIFGAWPIMSADSFMRQMAGFLFNIKTAIAAGLIILSLFISRFFCRVLCPLGAIYALFNKISIVRINHIQKNCVDCNKCGNACQLCLNPVKETASPECVRCGNCVRACDKKALKYGVPSE